MESNNRFYRYALEVLSEEEVCVNEPFRPIGLFYSKARQLQKLKYIPVIVRISFTSYLLIFSSSDLSK